MLARAQRASSDKLKADDIGIMLYTSGTPACPRGVSIHPPAVIESRIVNSTSTG